MPANHLYAEVVCPRCGVLEQIEVEVEIDGRGFAKDYKVGDLIDWLPGEVASIGELVKSGYVVCGRCGRDFFVEVFLSDGLVKSVAVDTSRKGYM